MDESPSKAYCSKPASFDWVNQNIYSACLSGKQTRRQCFAEKKRERRPFIKSEIKSEIAVATAAIFAVATAAIFAIATAARPIPAWPFSGQKTTIWVRSRPPHQDCFLWQHTRIGRPSSLQLPPLRLLFRAWLFVLVPCAMRKRGQRQTESNAVVRFRRVERQHWVGRAGQHWP